VTQNSPGDRLTEMAKQSGRWRQYASTILHDDWSRDLAERDVVIEDYAGRWRQHSNPSDSVCLNLKSLQTGSMSSNTLLCFCGGSSLWK